MTLAHNAVPGENGEVLDDESGFLAQFYGGRDNVGKAANILQRTIAPDLIGNIPPYQSLTFLDDLRPLWKQHEHGPLYHLLKSVIVDLRVLAGMTSDTAFMACPDAIDAMPGFRAVVLPTQAAERFEFKRQGAGRPGEHALDSFNASRWRIIKREQLPENVLHFVWSQELLYACIPYQPLGQPIIDFLLCVLFHGVFLLPFAQGYQSLGRSRIASKILKPLNGLYISTR